MPTKLYLVNRVLFHADGEVFGDVNEDSVQFAQRWIDYIEAPFLVVRGVSCKNQIVEAVAWTD